MHREFFGFFLKFEKFFEGLSFSYNLNFQIWMKNSLENSTFIIWWISYQKSSFFFEKSSTGSRNLNFEMKWFWQRLWSDKKYIKWEMRNMDLLEFFIKLDLDDKREFSLNLVWREN